MKTTRKKNQKHTTDRHKETLENILVENAG